MKAPKQRFSDKERSLHPDSVHHYPDAHKVISGNEHMGDDHLSHSSQQEPEKCHYLRVFIKGKITGWKDFNKVERTLVVISVTLKIFLVFFGLYIFAVALHLMSSGLKLVSGKAASKLFSDFTLLENPIAGVMIGIFVTVLLQSSSASTSIVVSMVSSGRTAIPIVMGANIGTSVTNSLVSFAHVRNKDEFERAFGGATVHDCFNALTTFILLIVEQATHLLEIVSGECVAGLDRNGMNITELQFVDLLTKPVAECIVTIDGEVGKCWLQPQCAATSTATSQLSDSGTYIFKNSGLSDKWVGLIVLLCSIIVIVLALLLIVKTMSSLIKEHFKIIVQKMSATKVPYVACVTGYLAILLGAILTFLVQSSSVFTSTLIPLVGIGVLSIEMMYPLTLGSNVGTTTTAILAAFASATSTNHFRVGVQIALCHFLFNMIGILIFYPIPIMRWPVFIASAIGRTAANYRWFAVVYMIVVFFLFPVLLIGLSFIGLYYSLAFALLVALIVIVSTVITIVQDNHPKWLPKWLRNWDFLPIWLTSLEPYDKVIAGLSCCNRCRVHSSVTSVQPQPTAERLKGSTVTLRSFKLSDDKDKDGSNPHHDNSKLGNQQELKDETKSAKALNE